MPFVPQVPGVPVLAAYAPAVALSILTSDASSLLAALFGPQWGIFFNGVPVVVSDNVVSIDYKQEWSISDYPLEKGAFESYDKVQVPFEARVRFSSGGSLIKKQALLKSISSIAGDTNLYDVVTPEAIYQSVSIKHYDYRRTAQNGVGLLQVDVHCVQIRVTAQAQFVNTQSPDGSSPQGSGTVQTSTPTAAQSGSLSGIQ